MGWQSGQGQQKRNGGRGQRAEDLAWEAGGGRVAGREVRAALGCAEAGVASWGRQPFSGSDLALAGASPFSRRRKKPKTVPLSWRPLLILTQSSRTPGPGA